MAGFYTLNFEARVKREGIWTVAATMKLSLADPSYGQGAIDGMMEILTAWQAAAPTIIQDWAITPRFDTMHVE